MINLFVSDIDHTLYSSELKKIPEENIAALKRLINKGVKIALASSRVYSGCLELARELDLKANDGYIIAYGGALVKRCKDDKVLLDERFEDEQVKNLYQLSKELEVGFNIAQDKYNIGTNYCKILDYDFYDVGMDYIVSHNIFKYVDEPIYKVSFSIDNGRERELLGILDERYGQEFAFAIPQPHTVDVALKRISKLTGLKAVIEDMGITLENVAGTGDNGNDVDMLSSIAISGCVANGSDEAKEVADYVVGNCKDAGVAQFIKEILKV